MKYSRTLLTFVKHTTLFIPTDELSFGFVKISAIYLVLQFSYLAMYVYSELL